MQPDQDRLREEIWQVFQDLDIRVDEGQGYLYDTTEAVERIQALIAREVRLENQWWINYYNGCIGLCLPDDSAGKEYYRILINRHEQRIAELSKEDTR